MTVTLRVMGKFLDQPILIARLGKVVPLGLAGAAGVHTAVVAAQEKTPEKRLKKGVKTGVILTSTIASALVAPKFASKITGKKLGGGLKQVVKENSKLVDEFVASATVSEKAKKILNSSKQKIVTPQDIVVLQKEMKDKNGRKFLDRLIPPPENVSSKDIFSEIGWLSIVGACPVVGGILGGVAADTLTGDDWKKGLPNKVKEGAYQYLANIFLCNVGAGAALGILEKNNIKSRTARGLGMLGGIVLTGVIGGSKIANIIGDKLINPLCGSKCKKHKGDERTPELVDIGLHVDDIATVSLLSGLKWIEPMLPVLYTVSGYRAGIGYRNNEKLNKC